MLNQLKARIPERVKGRLVAAMRPESSLAEPRTGEAPVAVVTLAGFYQNLGDLAITLAQKRFLEAALPSHEVVLVASHDTYPRIRALKRALRPGDLITTIGGGNTGDVYASLEDARSFIVRQLRAHPVIGFPQTIDFTDTPEGRRALRRSARSYGSHGRLTLFAREPQSAADMRRSFPGTEIVLAPDIVLSLRPVLPVRDRSGVLVCLRDDREAKLTPAHRDALIGALRDRFGEVLERDTTDVERAACTPATYESTLNAFWRLLSSRRVVVTDRLHCMIFCAITKTPCVVVPNSNHKIVGTHAAWLSTLDSIVLVEDSDPATVLDAAARLAEIEPASIPDLDLTEAFRPLVEAVQRAACVPASGDADGRS